MRLKESIPDDRDKVANHEPTSSSIAYDPNATIMSVVNNNEVINNNSVAAHELIGHSFDIDQGKVDISTYPQHPSADRPVLKAEVNGIDAENVMHYKNGESLRGYYTYPGDIPLNDLTVPNEVVKKVDNMLNDNNTESNGQLFIPKKDNTRNKKNIYNYQINKVLKK